MARVGRRGLGAGDGREGGDVGLCERLGYGVGDSCWEITCGQDGNAHVQFREEGKEGAVGAETANFVVGVDGLVGLICDG